MLLPKLLRNQIYEAIVASGVDPDCFSFVKDTSRTCNLRN
jgi:hypothetical protein